MTELVMLEAVGGSFRDPAGKVYINKSDGELRVLRGVNRETKENTEKLLQSAFFQRLTSEQRVVRTAEVDGNDPAAKRIVELGWDGVFEHEPVPFISYPYEWSFGMLRTAALLQLRVLEDALQEGWTLKDATPFNIQFVGCRPVFIDIPSFVPWGEGEPWVGYRQFCASFLIPLMMRAYLGIDHGAILRSNIDGIPPSEASKYFRGMSRFRKGVMSHIIMPAMVENRIASKERDDADSKDRSGITQSSRMVVALVQSMSRLVKSLKIKADHTDWSDYDSTHSYNQQEHEEKKEFVQNVLSEKHRKFVWDIGCNTGTFSNLAAENSDMVLAVDGDHAAIEKLYLKQKDNTESKILPLVLNLANPSPAQGWAGRERLAFDDRGKPDVLLALALIHHIRLSANIPFELFFAWLAELECEVVIEFVDRHDEMVVKLLTNKTEQYEDYNRDNFILQAEQNFKVKKSKILKGGKREIFHLTPT